MRYGPNRAFLSYDWDWMGSAGRRVPSRFRASTTIVFDRIDGTVKNTLLHGGLNVTSCVAYSQQSPRDLQRKTERSVSEGCDTELAHFFRGSAIVGSSFGQDQLNFPTPFRLASLRILALPAAHDDTSIISRLSPPTYPSQSDRSKLALHRLPLTSASQHSLPSAHCPSAPAPSQYLPPAHWDSAAPPSKVRVDRVRCRVPSAFGSWPCRLRIVP